MPATNVLQPINNVETLDSTASTVVVFNNRTATPRRENLAALTGLRFWAAMMIVAFHTIPAFKLDQRHITSGFGLPQGVTLFFVLSGFILTYNYANLRGFRQSAKFMFMRLARIWPTHAFCILAIFVLGIGVTSASYLRPENWLNLFLLQALFPYQQFFSSLNYPSWSVSTEFVFYLFLPVLLASSRKYHLAPLVVTSVFLAIALSIAHYCYSPLEPNGVWFGMAYINPFTRMLEFAIGIVSAQAFIRNRQKHAAIENPLTFFLVEFMCLSAAVFSIFYFPAMLETCHLPERFGAIKFYLSESGGAFVFAALIYALAVGRGFFSKLLSGRTMVWLGEISFAIYMTHVIVMLLFYKFDLVNRGFPRVGLYLCYLAALFVSAAAVNYLVERPARKYAKMFVVS